MKTVLVTPLSSMGANERGEGFSINSPRSSKNYMFVKRVAGSISGNHYHQGLLKEKAPEIIFLLQGSLKITIEHVKTGTIEEYIVERPSVIEIYPYVAHRFEALSDILFVECNSLEEHLKDTKPFVVRDLANSSK